MPDRKDHSASGAAIAGAGATTTGAGLAGGGVPGVKADVSVVRDKTPGIRAKARRVKAIRGGVLGFRHNAHAGGIYGFKQKATEEAWSGPPKSSHEAFWRGRNAGKIGPEEVILRHLGGGKKVAGAALVGGAGATAYGIHRARQKVQKDDRRARQASGTALGVGGTGLAVSGGTTHLLRHQGRKWGAEAERNLAAAGRLVPSTAGKTESEIKRSPQLLHGVPHKTAEAAGMLRGAAAQHAHFAHVYGDTAKIVGRIRAPSAAIGAAGAGGLLLTRRKKSQVAKAQPVMSDAQLRRRQKVQGKISRTTSTLGLAGVGLAGGGALLAHKPGALRKIPKYAKLSDEAIHAKGEKLKSAAFHTGIVSGGIGGVGGFNQASIYSAESRKRKQAMPTKPVSKSSGVEPVYASEVAKAWSPVSSEYDPERQRRKRSEAYPKIVSGASGALAGGAVGSGVHAGFSHKEAERYAAKLKNPKASSTLRTMRAGVRAKTKTAAALAGGSAALAGTAAVLHRRHKSESWQPYEKRYSMDGLSAFGVDHGEVSKAIGLPKGLRAAKGSGGFADNYVANRKMAHYTGKLIARKNAQDVQAGFRSGAGVFPHAGQRYKGKSKELVERATQRPRRKKVLP